MIMMATVEEKTLIINEPKKRGRKPHLNADGLPLSIEEKNNEQEIQQKEFTKIISNIVNYKKHVIIKGKKMKKNS